MDPAQEPSVTPTEPAVPATPVVAEPTNAPDRPEEVEEAPNTEMDTSADTTQPSQGAATAEIQNSQPVAETVTEITEDTPMQTDAPVAEATGENTEGNAQPTETESPEAPESTEQTESVPAPPEEEPATWAGVEEDTSSPDEEELKTIESSDGDYSALECMLFLLMTSLS